MNAQMNAHGGSSIRVYYDQISNFEIPPIVQKIAEPLFLWGDLGKHLYNGYFYGYRFVKRKSDPEETLTRIFLRAFENLLRTGAAVCSAITALHELGNIEMKASLGALFAAGNTLFVAAYFLTIESNISKYYAAKELINNPSTSPEDRATLLDMQDSALLEVMGSFSYVLMGCLVLFGAPLALTIVFGGLSTLTNGLKFIFDWFHCVPQGFEFVTE
jgi:hypothetical protein